MKPRAIAALFALVLAAAATGCRTAKGTDQAQDPGTSTGLPYRPPGKPTLVDVPPTYKVYPTPKALVR